MILNMLFNPLLKITPHNSQKRRRKKRKNKVCTFTMIFEVGSSYSS